MNQTMNDLALIAIGLGLGLCLTLVAVMVYALFRAASRMSQSVECMIALTKHSEGTIDRLRTDLTAALSRLDAERLYSASIGLQRLVKSLGLQVDTLQRTVFAQPAGPALDFTPTGMGLDEEAVDDARMLAERARWQQSANPPVDPLAGLTEQEKAVRVQQFFERRRQEQAAAGQVAGQVEVAAGTMGVYPWSSSPSSTPPAAGSGIYSSLLEEVGQHPQPVPAPADFSGLEPEEGVELSEKTELQ